MIRHSGVPIQMHVRLQMPSLFRSSHDLHLQYQVSNQARKIKEQDVKVDAPPGIGNGMHWQAWGQKVPEEIPCCERAIKRGEVRAFRER